VFFLLTSPISQLPGIGPSLALKFQKLGVFTIADLLGYYPRRWEDLSLLSPIISAQAGQKITVKGKLTTISHFRSPYKRMFITNGIIQDKSGPIKAIWFNQVYLKTALKKDQEYYFTGNVGNQQGHLTLMNPGFEVTDHLPLHSGRIVPIYPETTGVSSKVIRRAMKTLFNTIRHTPEILPAELTKKYRLVPLTSALENIHFPASETELVNAKHRLGFDELFLIQLSLAFIKANWGQQISQPIPTSFDFLPKFKKHLSFTLTNTQVKAIQEILADLASHKATNRLLLGDVGSGKTIVAAAAIVAVVQAGYQVALMAPTEVLAVQHYQNLQPLLKKFGVGIALLTGSTKSVSGEEIQTGQIDLVIGTHALIQKSVVFKNLNLVIIDEQHRFGVGQRYQLKNKSRETTPHFISLSATPIPRTVFLTLFSDLDVSILTEIPTGRLPIITRLATANNLDKVQALINKEIGQNHKVFVITPLINEDISAERASIASEIKNLAELFPQAKISALHGRLTAETKLQIMQDFKEGDINILLATSVIEVGIDVSAATVMWIKNAERFGLAQLHQLRGRVGRSNLQSYCLAETRAEEPETLERLKAFIYIRDGNELAKMDLALRGPGAFFDTQQSGFLKLKLANLLDEKLIRTTHAAAQSLIKQDPELKNYPELKKAIQLNLLPHSE